VNQSFTVLATQTITFNPIGAQLAQGTLNLVCYGPFPITSQFRFG
jgi:hypothetical protein